MPTTRLASDSTPYHLWQLPELSSPEPADTMEVNTLDNDLGDGYGSSVLFGSNAGLRSWKLKLPTLAGDSVPMPTITDINGATVSREQYLRSLFNEAKVNGTPFVYQDPHSGQYYLVRIVDPKLTMERSKFIALYGTGIELMQRRLLGKTVFDVGVLRPDTWIAEADETDLSGNGNAFHRTGDVTEDLQNNLATWRLNATLATGKLYQSEGALTLYDVFIVMKVRTATFGQTSGILTSVLGTGGGGTRLLIGENGQTRFQNLSITGYEYRLNGRLKSVTSQTAPMNNVWGIVHLRFTAGKSITDPQIGLDRAVSGTKAQIDVGEVILCTSQMPMDKVRELVEHLTIKWNVM